MVYLLTVNPMPRVKWGASTRIGHFPYGHFVQSFHRDTTHFTFFIKNTSSSVSVSYSDSDGTSLRVGSPAISSFWILSIFSILLQVFIFNFSVVRCSFDFWTAVRYSWLDIPNVQNGTNDDFSLSQVENESPWLISLGWLIHFRRWVISREQVHSQFIFRISHREKREIINIYQVYFYTKIREWVILGSNGQSK